MNGPPSSILDTDTQKTQITSRCNVRKYSEEPTSTSATAVGGDGASGGGQRSGLIFVLTFSQSPPPPNPTYPTPPARGCFLVCDGRG